ncbi:lipopolysaccharide biosynthesis protein [Flavobacteriaceae bacterium]|nr:lipopolysaccharide biosynthesis protein [Flavobacteriaceae bacterium]
MIKKLGLSFVWSFTNTFVDKSISFITMLIIARLIGPESFGLIGSIAIFIGIGTLLTNSGLSSSLIRTPKANQSDFSTVFILNLLISSIIYIVIYFFAPIIAEFYDNTKLENIIKIYCLIFLIIASSSVQLAILKKKMEFKKIALVSVPSTLFAALISLTLAYFDYGVWSLVWFHLSREIFKSIFLWASTVWHPKAIFSIIKFKLHFSFGYKLVLSGLIDVFFKNIYNIIIGKQFNFQELGFFERSRQLSEYPSSSLTGIISEVTYPMFSEIQNDIEKLTKIYVKLIQLSFFIIAPIMLGAAAVAKPLFLLVLGDEWSPAILYFQILSLAMMLYPLHAMNLNILKVFGRSDLFLKVEICKKIIVVISIVCFFNFGIIGLIWSIVFTSLTSLVINIYFSNKLITYTIYNQFKDLLITLLLSLITAFLINLFSDLLCNNSYIIQIILPVLLGLLIYISINFLLKKSPIHNCKIIITQILKKNDSSN